MKTSSNTLLAPGERDHAWDLNSMNMDLWMGAWSFATDIKVLHPRSPHGTNMSKGVASGGLAGLRYACGCQMITHSKRHIDNTFGVISVQRVHAGSTAVEFKDTAYVHRPGFITITDYMSEYRANQNHTVNEGVFIPRNRLGLSELHPVEPIIVPIGSTYGRMLSREINAFFATKPHGPAFDSSDLELIVSNIVSQDRLPTSDREDWWRGRKKLIRKYVETHLEDPNLGPLQICQLFNMSRATLYRMFESDGGVRRYIQDRRLYSAIWDLANGGTQRGRLSRVAERWGFSSDANFNRAAKVVVGMPPGAFFKRSVNAAPADMDHVPGEFPVYEWLRTVGKREAAGQF